MSNRSRTYLLLEERLGRQLDKRVMKARAAGQSWNQIARELDYDTHVPVTAETVRLWFDDADKARIARNARTVEDSVAS
jgi:hypothetical protein